MHAKTLAYQLELSNKLLDMNTGDVSHEESLARPPKGGSCLNQVVGHLTRTRTLALTSMGQKTPFPIEDFAPYDDRTGVAFSRDNALPFDELKRRFEALQEPLVRLIGGMSAETLAGKPPRKITGDPNETVGTNLATFVFHECYHVGQTGILRRVAGKPGVVKPPRG
ncbi:MAG: DinB family protein [Gemmatimonadales bacterium]